AFAHRGHEDPVNVQTGLVEELPRMESPHLPPCGVKSGMQGFAVVRGEAPTEITSRGWIRNPNGSQHVEISLVLTPQFQILKTASVRDRVVDEIQYVIRFKVRQMNLENRQPLID